HVLTCREVCRARAETPNDGAVGDLTRRGFERHPHVRRCSESEIVWHLRSTWKRESTGRDPDEGVWLGVQREHPANDVWISTEPTAPRGVAQYRDVIASRRLVSAFKKAADFRRDVKRLEEFSGSLDAIEAFGIDSFAEVV